MFIRSHILRGLLRFCLTLTCLFLGSVFGFHVRAQGTEIRARVIDSTDLEPVPFSTVYLDEYTGTISDELGFFRLQVSPGRPDDTLTVSCIGYLSRRIPLRELGLHRLDSIYLRPNIVALGEVTVEARSGRPPRKKEIIREAISRIRDNYPGIPVLYNGYYREYVKKDDEYINLFESIINLEDPGFGSVDNFSAGLQYKRINQDFLIDTFLMRPYDNLTKFVPYSRMPIPLNNELVILRAHDPVRNYNRNSLYFIDRLEVDFIRNHEFGDPQLTYLDDRPYFSISFRDNQKYTRGVNRITARGTIYIDAYNYGIKRINYRGTVEKGTERQKLFELSLEYELVDDTYFLHYLSFNNLFNTRSFALVNTSLYADMLALTFNRPIYPGCVGDPDNITVLLNGEPQEIRKMEYRNNVLLLSFRRNTALAEKLGINILPISIQTRRKISENEKSLLRDVKVMFGDFRDEQGNLIADRELEPYYQYREFFTNRTQVSQNGITSNLVDKSRPVIESRIFGEYRGDTSWLNTPLIAEDVAARTFYSNNRKLNGFIETRFENSENRLSELVYLHTDREVYAPEDTLWFRAYVRNRKYLSSSGLSKNFDIILADSRGEIVSRERYLNTDHGVHGHLFLGHTLEEGVYYLLGYTSWMTNFGTEQIFSKRILVMKDKRDDLLLAAAFDRQEYFPGDTIRMLVNCYDGFNREVDDVMFTYRFVSGRRTLQRGRGSTDRSWLYPVNLVIPADIDTMPVVEFVSEYKGVRLDTVYVPSVNRYVRVDFFPEGGNCINGLEGMMAFKAVTNTGNPVEVAGEIVDRDGEVTGTASSRHDGMGVFPYKPEEGRQRYFRITEPAGLNSVFPLPEGINRGWQLSVTGYDREAGELEVGINNIDTGSDSALITLSVRGYLCYYAAVRAGRKRSLKIPLPGLPAGIGVLTLFDGELMPRAERLVYIQPDKKYHAEVTTDRENYIPRDSVLLSFTLSCDQPVVPGGTYSLAVIDEELCTTDMLDEPDISTSMLLSTEIRGKVHNPGYYFDQRNTGAVADLDLLLLTQGWRQYRYPDESGQPLAETLATPTGRPTGRDVISGRLMKQPFGRELTPTDGQLSVLFGGNTTVIPVGRDGEFSFLPDYSTEFNTGLYMYAVDGSGKSNLSIVLNSTTFEDDLETYLEYLTDSLGRERLEPVFSQERLQDRFSLNLENHQWLEEVVIRKTVVRRQLTEADLAFSKRTAKQDQIDAAANMQHLETLVQRLGTGGSAPWYVIDGVLQFTWEGDGMSLPVMVPDYTYAYSIQPEEILEYTVVSGMDVSSLYGYWVGGYVIDVTLKPWDERAAGRRWENPVSIGKFTVSKEFYKPLYDTPEKRRSTIPDLRKTIHWEPELQLDEEGKALVTFYNGDRYTRIRCILEGITDDGVPVHTEHTYNVTLTREQPVGR